MTAEPAWREEIRQALEHAARRGLRVIGYRPAGDGRLAFDHAPLKAKRGADRATLGILLSEAAEAMPPPGRRRFRSALAGELTDPPEPPAPTKPRTTKAAKRERARPAQSRLL